MEEATNKLVEAVINSFRDANLRVELLPAQTKTDVGRMDAGSGPPQPFRQHNQMPNFHGHPHGHSHPNMYKSSPMTLRVDTGTGPIREKHNATAQAVDGRYTTSYKLHHCNMTPTSPPEMPTEFPPQRVEISRGYDNFQVGGNGSGETYMPNKATSGRGMPSSSRGVLNNRVAPSDPFATSLRKYPSLSPEHTAEVLERIAYYAQPKISRPPPQRTHSPTKHERSNLCYHSAQAYEDSYAARCKPRAPEDSPTRDRRVDGYRKQMFMAQSDLRGLRDSSRRLRESIKSISSYTHTLTTSACTENNGQGWYEPHVPETSESEVQLREELPQGPPIVLGTSTANSTVQAVASTISREVETVVLSVPSKCSIAISPSPMPSNPRLSDHGPDASERLITRSVQTLLPGRSVETTTSLVDLSKHDRPKVIQESKSESIIKCDFEKEIITWLDDISEPKIKDIQQTVVRNLINRLNGTTVPASDKIKVRIGNCLKSRRTDAKEFKVIQVYNQDGIRPEVIPRLTTNQSDFEDIIHEWLNNISIKKRDILLRPVQKDQIYNTFVNRLKHLVVKQSVHSRESSLRAEILEILHEVPIEVNARDKTVYLDKITDALMSKLDDLSGDYADAVYSTCDVPKKLHMNSNCFSPTEKTEVDPNLANEVIVDENILNRDKVNSNEGLEVLARLIHKVTKLPEQEAFQYASQIVEYWKEHFNEKQTNSHKGRPVTMVMVQNVSANLPTQTSDQMLGNNVSQHSIGSIVDKDIEANLKQYKIEVVKQIHRWLSGVADLQAHDQNFRQAVVLDLASDILRTKYLEFIKNRDTYADDLEHLKYQIYKWIKRFIGQENNNTLDHAAELLEIIRSIPVPMFNTYQHEMQSRNISNESVHRSKSNSGTCTSENTQSNRIFTNYIVHKVFAKRSLDLDLRKLNGYRPSNKSSSGLNRSHSSINMKTGTNSLRHSSRNRKHSAETKNTKKLKEKTKNTQTFLINIVDYDTAQNNTAQSDNRPEEASQIPGPSGLAVSPIPSAIGKSSATSKLMADWRPPQIFTSPVPGKDKDSVLGQVYDEYREYLKNWCQKIPISADTPDKVAEKLRLGILNGVWKTITKIKTQPGVFQNRFYYEDVLGKEIDGLLDCLPQTQELKNKRYSLKAELLEKTSNMNELVKELEMPDNYKKMIELKTQEKKDETLRKVVKLDAQNPSQNFEEMLAYCLLDDFLVETDYKEKDKLKANAYRIKLLRIIRAYLDELRKTHGKEIEDLYNAVIESDLFIVLSKVPLPTNDDMKKDADELLLGLEVEQWMRNLPIVKNDDESEQRQRRRLMDALTKKLLVMKKGVNDAECGETQIKHEISFFLDKVPLERNQDLNINEMVEELTNRLNSRFGDKKKEVAFQDGPQTQRNQSSGVLHRSQLADAPGPNRIYTTRDEWPSDEDEDAQYRALFKNDPLCSTKINIEHTTQDDPDASYRSMFKERPPNSTMIGPQTGYGLDENASRLPDFHQVYEQEPYFVYAPDQFYEIARGGAFGYPPHGPLPQPDDRYRYPDPTGPPLHRLFDSEGYTIPNVSLPDARHRQVNVPQGYIANMDAGRVPPMQAPNRASYPQPQEMESQNEASEGFVSMMDHDSPRSPRSYSPPRPQVQQAESSQKNYVPNQEGFTSIEDASHPAMYMSGQRHTNRRHIQQEVPRDGLQNRSDRNQRSLVEPHQPDYFVTDSTPQSMGAPPVLRLTRIDLDPNMLQKEPYLVLEDARFSRGPTFQGERAQKPVMVQVEPAAQGGFVSIASHRIPHEEHSLPIAITTPARDQHRPQTMNHSHRSQPQREASQRAPDPPLEHRRFSGREGIQEIRNQNRSAHRSPQNVQLSSYRAGQGAQNGSNMREPTSTGEATSGVPSSSTQRPNRGLLAANIPSTEISERPEAYSTPNQPIGAEPSAGPNMRERRQLERAAARRLDIDTEEGEERCHCMERFKRWSRRTGATCSTCEECRQGGSAHFYSCPYPYLYPDAYPPFIRSPYPPYCRR